MWTINVFRNIDLQVSANAKNGCVSFIQNTHTHLILAYIFGGSL